jgi:hypothetical protein
MVSSQSGAHRVVAKIPNYEARTLGDSLETSNMEHKVRVCGWIP